MHFITATLVRRDLDQTVLDELNYSESSFGFSESSFGFLEAGTSSLFFIFASRRSLFTPFDLSGRATSPTYEPKLSIELFK